MGSSKLLRKTLHLLINRPRTLTLAEIVQRSEAKGGESSINWLSMIAHGKIVDPPVSRVEVLYEVLTGKSLPLD